ncbi:putative bifunctional diguanylate cyclase/phosphodiesterase [Bacillus coahuilensis]|uniref:putative bifunctional diguanylate cyclase/phosphodiesterase n=1 Tax=Bacillus coahuilensis TaxID=408580 RepID=UPI0012ACDE86|nr:GGDEF and EAL domain-containing protein [Bacillus coahuilensis]
MNRVKVGSKRVFIVAMASIGIISFLLKIILHQLFLIESDWTNFFALLLSFSAIGLFIYFHILTGNRSIWTFSVQTIGLVTIIESIYWIWFRYPVIFHADSTINLLLVIVAIPNLLFVVNGFQRASKIEQKLMQNEQQLKTIYQSIDVGIYLMNVTSKKVHFVSSGMEKLTGIPQKDLLVNYDYYKEMIHPEDASRLNFLTFQGIQQDSVKREYRIIKNNGEVRYIKERLYPYQDGHSETSLLTCILFDVTEEKMKNQKIEFLAYHDELTGVYNRRFLEKYINELNENEQKSHENLSLMYIDLDRFKAINDLYSHEVGDNLLREFALRLKECLGDYGKVIRLGGDEFCILLAVDEKQVESLAEKMVDVLKVPFIINSYELSLSCSIGVVHSNLHKIHINQLLKQADAALYHVKGSGRNGYAVFDEPLYIKFERRNQIERELKEATTSQRLNLYYQPQYKGSEIVGMEALARLKMKNGESVSPSEFIPIAEETGLMPDIGEYVLRKACQQVRTWSEKGFTPITVAVNISVKQLENQNLDQLVYDILKETEVSPLHLELEITESVGLFVNCEVVGQLENIRDLGVRVTLDDFGTGFSSLAYLHTFPLNGIKVARDFIMNIENNEKSLNVTKAIISMGNHLHLRVLAEGVESKEQMDSLVQMGCDYFQGYYFNKPMPSDAVTTLLEQRKLSQLQ